MARRRTFSNDLTAGEIGPEFLQRTDEELLNKSAQTLGNTIVLNAGGARRRPGGRPRVATSGVKRRLEVFDLTDDDLREVVISAGKLEIFDGVTLEDTIVGPWLETDIDTITVVNGDNEFYILGGFPIQVLAYDGATFSMGAFVFSSGIGSALRQPYWRFAAKGITLLPSAASGTITVTASSAVFVAGHVGTRFRYLNNEIEITVVTSDVLATGTVITPLYPTVQITVSSVAPYKVGHIVKGDTTEIQGQVAAVGVGTIDVTLLDGYTYFDAAEVIVSPEGRATASGVSLVSPAASTIWDEQMVSSVRGYPRTGALHRNRLILAGFPEAANAVAASAIGFPKDFDLGSAADQDAFIEALGDDPNAAIRHIIAAEQMVLLTDRGCYYVPESEQSPLSPTRVQFLRISPDGASRVRPILTPEGVVFVDNADRLLVIAATGSVRASWAVSELSLLAKHLVTGPIELTYVDGLGARSERYILVRNADGTIAVMNYRRGADQAGMTLWTPAPGTDWQAFAAWKTGLYCVHDGILCDIDLDTVMDLQCDYSAACPLMTGRSVYVMRGNQVWRGPFTVDGSGLIDGIAPAAGLAIGHDFRVSVRPNAPVSKYIGFERRRYPRLWVDVLNSGAFRVNGDLRTGWTSLDDIEAPAPWMTGGQEPFFLLGFDPNEMPEISQEVGEGAPFLLRSMTLEVSY